MPGVKRAAGPGLCVVGLRRPRSCRCSRVSTVVPSRTPAQIFTFTGRCGLFEVWLCGFRFYGAGYRTPVPLCRLSSGAGPPGSRASDHQTPREEPCSGGWEAVSARPGLARKVLPRRRHHVLVARPALADPPNRQLPPRPRPPVRALTALCTDLLKFWRVHCRLGVVGTGVCSILQRLQKPGCGSGEEG